MSVLTGLKTRLRSLTSCRSTFREFILAYVDRLSLGVFGRNTNLLIRERNRRVTGRFRMPIVKSKDAYHIRDAKLPILDSRDEYTLFTLVWEDTFCSYVNFNDKYDEETFNFCDSFLLEGLYGLVNERVNVMVEPGDVVIDAGSWIGDFAAYASVRGAGAVYAFEPSEQNFKNLERTAELNKNIIPVKKGLSDKSRGMTFFTHNAGNTGANSFMDMKEDKNYSEASSLVETVRLDDFVRENNLQRVDFIKADIEGFERHMLAGAQETLKHFAPKLALCTYHLPDDPQVMAELILKANPNYHIVQKRCKLFASVPK